MFYILSEIILLTKIIYLHKTESTIVLNSSVILMSLYKFMQKVCRNNERDEIKEEVKNEEK